MKRCAHHPAERLTIGRPWTQPSGLQRDLDPAERVKSIQQIREADPHEAFTLQGHTAIAEGWQTWFIQAQPLRRSASWAPYANAYNLAEIPVAAAVRAAFPEISPRSAQRWVYEYERGNLSAMVDRRNGAARRGQTVFHSLPLLAAAATRMLLDKPGIRTQQLVTLLRIIDAEEFFHLVVAEGLGAHVRHRQFASR